MVIGNQTKEEVQEDEDKMNWKKRLISFALALLVSVSTFMTSGMDAQAAGVIAKGVDVSKYQGAINWSAVAADGYSFAFIKVGSAKSGLDPYFAANMVCLLYTSLR